MTRLDRFWNLLIILLVVVIAIGGIIIWSKYRPGQPVEISLAPRQELPGEVYIGGAVNNPAIYPFRADDSLEALIRAAGGTTNGSSSPTQLRLYVPGAEEGQPPQKVNINRAEAWLLQALPGIGEARARAIIDYRSKNGPFRNTNELLKVEGFGTATYERIKDLITVAD